MLVLALIAVPVVEVLAFIEVGHAIGWLPAVIALLGISVIGTRLLRIKGRAAIEGVSLAVSERRAPTGAAIDGALGLLGAMLLVDLSPTWPVPCSCFHPADGWHVAGSPVNMPPG